MLKVLANKFVKAQNLVREVIIERDHHLPIIIIKSMVVNVAIKEIKVTVVKLRKILMMIKDM